MDKQVNMQTIFYFAGCPDNTHLLLSWKKIIILLKNKFLLIWNLHFPSIYPYPQIWFLVIYSSLLNDFYFIK